MKERKMDLQEYSIVSINPGVSLLNNFINKRVVRYLQIEIYEIISIYNSTRVECDERKNKLFFFYIIIAHYTLHIYTQEDIDSFYEKNAYMHYEVEKIIFISYFAFQVYIEEQRNENVI